MGAAARTTASAAGAGARQTPLPIRAILPADEPSPRCDHVLVEVLPFGIVQASGAAWTGRVPAYFAPQRFGSLSQAIVAAHAWARTHGIERIHLLNRPVPAA